MPLFAPNFEQILHKIKHLSQKNYALTEEILGFSGEKSGECDNENYGGVWSKLGTNSPTHCAIRFAPSSTIIFAPCHILLRLMHLKRTLKNPEQIPRNMPKFREELKWNGAKNYKFSRQDSAGPNRHI